MTKKEIGKAISEKIKETGVSYYSINKAIRVQRSVVKSIESGEAYYTLDSLEKLCNFLNLQIIIK